MKGSVAWWSFENAGLSANELIRATATLGYAGFEFAPEDQWISIRDAGLDIVADRGHQGIGRGLNDLSQHVRCEGEIRASIERSSRWRIPILVCFSGERHGIDDEAGAVNTATLLRRVARDAEEAGVLLALELLNSKVDHPDYQCDHTPWGVKVVEWVDSPAVKLLYDVYHMQIMEGDVMRTIQQHHQHIGHYHIAGNPGRHDPDASQELNYPAILQTIADTGYGGYVGMEYIPVGDPVESLRDAMTLLR